MQRQTGNLYEILGEKNRKNNFVVPYVSGARLNSFFEAVVMFRNIPKFCFLYTCSNPTFIVRQDKDIIVRQDKGLLNGMFFVSFSSIRIKFENDKNCRSK